MIQAYAHTHGGTDPSPALVKQILVSSATDIDAPADQQGAGLLNIGAAVTLADPSPARPGATAACHPNGGGHPGHPGQVNFVGQPGSPESSRFR